MGQEMEGKSADIYMRDDVISSGWRYDKNGFKVEYVVRLRKVPPDIPLVMTCDGGFPVRLDQKGW